MTPSKRAGICAAVLPILLCLLVVGSLIVSAPTAAASEPRLSGKVLRVIDGDTVDVFLASGRIRVRLHGVDAPERDQPYGPASGKWLSQQLNDEIVQLQPVSQDQYGRMVAVVHLDDRNINQELVRAGHAWAYRRYLRRSDRGLCDVEMRARRQRAGLWAATAHAPWEFRATKGKGPFRNYAGSTADDCRKQAGRR